MQVHNHTHTYTNTKQSHTTDYKCKITHTHRCSHRRGRGHCARPTGAHTCAHTCSLQTYKPRATVAATRTQAGTWGPTQNPRHTISRTHSHPSLGPTYQTAYTTVAIGVMITLTADTRGLEGGQDLKPNPGSPPDRMSGRTPAMMWPPCRMRRVSYPTSQVRPHLPSPCPPQPLTMSGAPGVTALTHRHGES